MASSRSSSFAEVCGKRIEYQRIDAPGAGPTLVFLHEGLGSITQWRDFPARISALTGLPAIVYARYGYGQSAVLRAAHGADFMHREAQEALPEFLRLLGIGDPLLVGHSDGASIALIHAGSGHPVRGLALIAPHVFVEDISIRGIVAARRAFEAGDLRERLARHHRDPVKTFYGWNDIWLAPEFRSWNIENVLSHIRCPVLAIQGEGDEYGSMAQLDAIARQAGGAVELLKLEACGHSPQRDQPDRVADAIAGFVARCAAQTGST